MAINEACLILVEGDQLLDATIVASLAILLSAGVTHMHKMPGPKVRVFITKAMAIRVMVMVVVIVMGRPMVDPMLWMPMISRGI